MNKHLLACFMMLVSFTGCVKTTNIKRDFYTTTPQTHMLSLHECPDFISHSEAPLQSIIIACNAARFEHYMIYFEHINDTLTTIRVSSAHGFATLWIDSHQNSCILDFFCIDDRYSYPDFVDAFMAEFALVETRETLFDDFLEMWD